jgi:hypothetical protein
MNPTTYYPRYVDSCYLSHWDIHWSFFLFYHCGLRRFDTFVVPVIGIAKDVGRCLVRSSFTPILSTILIQPSVCLAGLPPSTSGPCPEWFITCVHHARLGTPSTSILTLHIINVPSESRVPPHSFNGSLCRRGRCAFTQSIPGMNPTTYYPRYVDSCHLSDWDMYWYLFRF